jgi:hypothetical protein
MESGFATINGNVESGFATINGNVRSVAMQLAR